MQTASDIISHYSAGERERDGLLLRLGLCFLGLMLAFLLGGGEAAAGDLDLDH